MTRFILRIASLVLVLGMAASAMATTSNFTMLDPTGAPVGGTNDVNFTWDGSMATSVAASGQVSNATLYKSWMWDVIAWEAHDVMIYAPGTYTVYADAAAGSPGTSGGNPAMAITFAVGAHMLFDWPDYADNNIDIVNIWTANNPGNGPFWTGS